jgi:1,4-alpha-glucan branching enzyme
LIILRNLYHVHRLSQMTPLVTRGKTQMIRRQTIPNSNQVQITFVLPADFPHVPISVVGDFNQWDPSAHPLRQASDGTYQATVTLAADRRYAFRYLSHGGKWFQEGFADDLAPGPVGGYNSIVVT